LWSNDRLATVARESELWAKLTPYLGEFVNRVPTDDREAERVHLARLCVTIEEKIRELGGSVHLAHSQYYGDPLIIESIARFLESGELPAECERDELLIQELPSRPGELQMWMVSKGKK
jgi:hypothetical protein